MDDKRNISSISAQWDGYAQNAALGCGEISKMECYNGSKNIYHICNERHWFMKSCDDCEANNDCTRQFTADMLHQAYAMKVQFLGYHQFSLQMLVNGDAQPVITFKGTETNYRDVVESLTMCEETPFCRVGEKRATGNDCELAEDALLFCLYPNSLGNACIEFPCNMSLSVKEHNHNQFLNQATVYKPWEYFFSEKMLVVSVVSLFLTVVLYCVIPELRNQFGYLQINCFLTYLISNLFLFVSAKAGTVKPLCVCSAVMLHFSLLSSFCWMMVTGSVILKMMHLMNRQISQATVNVVRYPSGKYIASHIVGHGLPGVFVVGCVIADLWYQPGSVSYGQGPFCWIHNKKSLFATFIVPSGILLLMNIIIFVCCCFSFLSIYKRNHNASSTMGHRWTFFVLAKLLVGSGMQWLFGVISHFYPNDEIVRFIFILLVSVHGILILLMTLLLKTVRRKLLFWRRQRIAVVISVVSS